MIYLTSSKSAVREHPLAEKGTFSNPPRRKSSISTLKGHVGPIGVLWTNSWFFEWLWWNDNPAVVCNVPKQMYWCTIFPLVIKHGVLENTWKYTMSSVMFLLKPHWIEWISNCAAIKPKQLVVFPIHGQSLIQKTGWIQLKDQPMICIVNPLFRTFRTIEDDFDKASILFNNYTFPLFCIKHMHFIYGHIRHIPIILNNFWSVDQSIPIPVRYLDKIIPVSQFPFLPTESQVKSINKNVIIGPDNPTC